MACICINHGAEDELLLIKSTIIHNFVENFTVSEQNQIQICKTDNFTGILYTVLGLI